MAGYSGTPLPKKLGIKDGLKIGFVHHPENFSELLGVLPSSVQIVPRITKPIDLVVIFVKQQRVLEKEFSNLATKLSTDGTIWVAWPKKSSGEKTDLNFNIVQRIGLDSGLVDVKICAIDDVWSGLKFVYRLKDRKK